MKYLGVLAFNECYQFEKIEEQNTEECSNSDKQSPFHINASVANVYEETKLFYYHACRSEEFAYGYSFGDVQ